MHRNKRDDWIIIKLTGAALKMYMRAMQPLGATKELLN